MIDRSFIGWESEPYEVEVEAGRLRLFGKAIGEELGTTAPLTFGFSIELERPVAFELLQAMGVPLARVLHGEQSFRYLRPIQAGQTITVRSRVTDIRTKKSGALQLIDRETTLSHADGEPAVVMTSVIVVRGGS